MTSTAEARIVILGAGYAGLRCALELNRRLGRGHQITLVDRHPYQLINPALYQAATAETSNRAVTIPLKTVLERTGITFIRSHIRAVDTQARIVRLGEGQLTYDFLVIALGSEVDYYGIPGLQRHAVPLKTVYDAGWLRLNLRRLFETDGENPKRVIVGGGGFTGCELVGELVLAVESLADSHGVPRGKVTVTIVEGATQLLPGLPEKVGVRVGRRLEWLGVKIHTGCRITRADRGHLELSTAERLDYDLLIWTGGIKPSGTRADAGIERQKRGHIVADEFLRCRPNVFVAGDLAFFEDPATGRPLPATIPVAVQQGKSVGRNIARLVDGRPMKRFRPRHAGFVIPLTGKYAVAVFELPGKPVLTGRVAFAMFEAVLLRYFLTILPLRAALAQWRLWQRDVGRVHAAAQLYARK